MTLLGIGAVICLPASDAPAPQHTSESEAVGTFAQSPIRHCYVCVCLNIKRQNSNWRGGPFGLSLGQPQKNTLRNKNTLINTPPLKLQPVSPQQQIKSSWPPALL